MDKRKNRYRKTVIVINTMSLYNYFSLHLQVCWMSHIGVNRPDLGGTVLNSATVSRCPALLAFNPDFTKLCS